MSDGFNFKKAAFIVNPVAGKMRVKNGMFKIIEAFSNADIDVNVRTTRFRGDATALAEKKASEVEAIICCGGDGTLNEVITGVIASGKNIPVGYIPAGSTNDFANTFGIPSELTKATKALLAGNTNKIDIGEFCAEDIGDKRYFTYIASFGAFASTSYSAPQSVKNVLGHLAYVLEGIKDVPSIQPIHVKARMNGKTYDEDILFGAVANSVSIGGIINIDKSLVDLNDGEFEVIMIKVPKNPGDLAKILEAINSKTYSCDQIIFEKTKNIVVSSTAPIAWTLDGEFGGNTTHANISNLHSRITLII